MNIFSFDDFGRAYGCSPPFPHRKPEHRATWSADYASYELLTPRMEHSGGSLRTSLSFYPRLVKDRLRPAPQEMTERRVGSWRRVLSLGYPRRGCLAHGLRVSVRSVRPNVRGLSADSLRTLPSMIRATRARRSGYRPFALFSRAKPSDGPYLPMLSSLRPAISRTRRGSCKEPLPTGDSPGGEKTIGRIVMSASAWTEIGTNTSTNSFVSISGDNAGNAWAGDPSRYIWSDSL
jgi:hypothetical protein